MLLVDLDRFECAACAWRASTRSQSTMGLDWFDASSGRASNPGIFGVTSFMRAK
jgi:hypothetical protein